jgi:tRNA-Thr(GGU) m(6)t(6)A37 methyltransferase TsaA
MKDIEFESIGKIHTPYKELKGMPIQPVGAQGVKGEIHIKDKYSNGLKDLTGFSHLNLIYHLHKVKDYNLEVKPFLDTKTHGIFATRSPKRPNPIGLSVVKLDKVEDNIVYVSNVDILDETPIIDIKPYVPQLYQDTIEDLKIGWFETKHENAKTKKADDRFID